MPKGSFVLLWTAEGARSSRLFTERTRRDTPIVSPIIYRSLRKRSWRSFRDLPFCSVTRFRSMAIDSRGNAATGSPLPLPSTTSRGHRSFVGWRETDCRKEVQPIPGISRPCMRGLQTQKSGEKGEVSRTRGLQRTAPRNGSIAAFEEIPCEGPQGRGARFRPRIERERIFLMPTRSPPYRQLLRPVPFSLSPRIAGCAGRYGPLCIDNSSKG